MRTIVVTSTKELWSAAQREGLYSQSTVDSSLKEVGYIHATSPDQTISMLNRIYRDRDDIILLLIDLDKVRSEVKFEASSSGKTPGLFPHIYGHLNVDAVYDILLPEKDNSDSFVDNDRLAQLTS